MTWRQLLPRLILEITVCVTPNREPISACLTRRFNKRLISATSLSDNLDRPFLTPLRSPPLPLRTLSAALSLSVPRKRWSGRTQPGLSQLCRTSRPGGTGPLTNSHATLCAKKSLCPKPMRPYPSLILQASHSQQQGVLATLDQNRSISRTVSYLGRGRHASR